MGVRVNRSRVSISDQSRDSDSGGRRWGVGKRWIADGLQWAVVGNRRVMGECMNHQRTTSAMAMSDVNRNQQGGPRLAARTAWNHYGKRRSSPRLSL